VAPFVAQSDLWKVIQPVKQPLLLYQVLVTKRKSEDSWELTSWRGTTIRPCPDDIAEQLQLDVEILHVLFRLHNESGFCFLYLYRFPNLMEL